jgi:serine/threonine-protein kinase
MIDPIDPAARWARVKDLFGSALTLPASERPAFLAAACGEDADLRGEVESLLGALVEAGSLVEGTAAAELAEGAPDPLIGRHVGPYRVLAEIGRGGMGAVYCAVRDDDVFRKSVALKVLRGGLSTDFHRESFHRERQILAGLQHPNVAQLLDGGTTDDGRPYLVMELLAGEPIDVYCARRQSTVRERLELFRQVCAAVQCAHQSLVVHRDLKPANILVTGDGVPKLLDFGIAKLLPAQGGEATVTQVRALTPVYASPEQLLGQPITTASDVYSLGVVLYELLTGRRPFDFELHPGEELFHRIRHEEPLRPSTAARDTPSPGSPVSATVLVDGTAPVATRLSLPARRARELSGDLDTIVMTALAKEPPRRYGSAEALSEDLRRHLAGLPIAARKPTLAYRAGKFVRRHPGGVAAAALAVASLLAGIVATTVQGRRAEAERVRAERQAERATAVTRFLKETLGAAHPETGLGRSATVLEALEAARARVVGAFEGSPDIQAAVRVAIGETYGALGRYEEAEPLLRSALEAQRRELGEESVEVADTLRVLGELLMQRGQLEEAETHLRRALALRESLLGPEHVSVAHALDALGTLHWTRGDVQSATREFRRAIAIVERQPGPKDHDLATMLGNLAAAVEDADPREAARLYRRALDMWAAMGQTKGPGYAGAVSNLGMLLRDQGDHAGAEPLLREALALDRELMGERHPNVAASLVNLAGLLRARGDTAAARPLFVEAIGILEAAVGREHWSVGRAREGLGLCFRREGRLADAERELRAAVDILTKSVGAEDERTKRAAGNLAELRAAGKQPAAAAP